MALRSTQFCFWYYNSSHASRAATILSWGRLPKPAADWQSACPQRPAISLHQRLVCLRPTAMYNYAFASSHAATILGCRKLVAEAMWGRLPKPAADCQNRPAATGRRPPRTGGSRLRLAAVRGRLSTCGRLLIGLGGAANSGCSRLSAGFFVAPAILSPVLLHS
jgi:hypothetical protein